MAPGTANGQRDAGAASLTLQLYVAMIPVGGRMPPVDSPGSFLAVVLQAFVTQTGAYFALVSVLFLVLWRWGERALAARKLQKQRRVDGAQLRHELRHTVGALVAGTTTAAAILFIVGSGRSAFTTDLAAAGGPAGVSLSLLGLVLFNDLWFYVVHRILHLPFLFKFIHLTHHRSVDVNPFSSYSFHFLEPLMLSAWFIPVAFFVPLYLPALGALQVIGLLNNLMSHLGYELMPPWILKIPVIRMTNTATFHNMHHIYFNGNYGLHTRIWDRLLGTEVEGYERAFLARDVAAARTPSSSSPSPSPDAATNA
jgi:sterol desaturase/sphingolipid hydroxylase (fatty acid hydroxylase superfamily)